MRLPDFLRRKAHELPPKEAVAGLIARTGMPQPDGSTFSTRVRRTDAGGVDILFAPPEGWPDREKVWADDQRRWENERR